jgi:FlaA1/EpsC-like NDP-sugar epimerase
MSKPFRLLEQPSAFESVPDALVRSITGRNDPLTAADMAAHAEAVAAAFTGRRVLVVGAAGSIGAATVAAICGLRPASLALVDISENALADLVRRLRAGGTPVPEDFSTSVVAAGTPGFARYFAAEGPFDLTMNFAALKHVRSERDPYSLMRLLETNVLATDQLVELIRQSGGRLFSVSSDKAVYPASLMGASKRWMELLLADGRVQATSARFANVAFSAGSLLHAFKDRLLARQPFGAPSDVARYFISHREAAELCILAAALGAPGEVFVPRLTAERDLLPMTEAARRVLDFCGLEPELHADEASAKASPELRAEHPAAWPCVFAPSDTAGEKPAEEFAYPDEPLDEDRLAALSVARIAPAAPERLRAALDALISLQAAPSWDKTEIVRIVAGIVPELAHVESARSLDAKL